MNTCYNASFLFPVLCGIPVSALSFGLSPARWIEAFILAELFDW